jgi:hypothetical protein
MISLNLASQIFQFAGFILAAFKMTRTFVEDASFGAGVLH